MAGVRQIAELAGVSRGTVDRVLNGRGHVRPETAARVLEIARALNYTPNRAGQALALCKNPAKVGFVLFSPLTNPFFEDVVAGVNAKSEALRDSGVQVLLRYADFGSHTHQLQLVEELLDQGAQGLALTPVNHPEVAARLRQLAQQGVPVVTVNTDIAGSNRLCYVGSDYAQGGRVAAGLMGLICGGRAQVGIVSGSPSVLCHTERVAGFTAHLQKHYPGVQVARLAHNNDDDVESYAVTKAMLEATPGIDALYLAAAGVYGACRAVQQLGLAGRLRVVCYDTVPATRRLLEDGVIAAAIGQQPVQQGARPLEILADLLCEDKNPAQDCYYCAHEIHIRENI